MVLFDAEKLSSLHYYLDPLPDTPFLLGVLLLLFFVFHLLLPWSLPLRLRSLLQQHWLEFFSWAGIFFAAARYMHLPWLSMRLWVVLCFLALLVLDGLFLVRVVTTPRAERGHEDDTADDTPVS
ncbi:hypothetical protein H6771_02495 [Candidatus Peribacteria bacterium]|nr:hypothetical protein [Candidatus Peribacteria bacterium]